MTPLCSGEPEPLIKSPVWYLGLKSAGNSHIIANYSAAAIKKKHKIKGSAGREMMVENGSHESAFCWGLAQ